MRNGVDPHESRGHFPRFSNHPLVRGSPQTPGPGFDMIGFEAASGASVQSLPVLHVLVFQEMPGVWVGRALEHDIRTEAGSIGAAVRAVVRLVDAHTAFDQRHNRPPLSAFGAAPQSCWRVFQLGTPLPLSQVGVDHPLQWQVIAAVAHRRPTASHVSGLTTFAATIRTSGT